MEDVCRDGKIATYPTNTTRFALFGMIWGDGYQIWDRYESFFVNPDSSSG